jgi:hypothetical protein
MSRFALALVALAAALACAAAAAAAPRSSTTYTFGRTGGNIDPFTVSIAADGSVLARGPVRTAGTATGLAHLAAVMRAQRFGSLPATIRCTGALPDFAAFYVTVHNGTSARTVLAHGGCNARFNAVLKAFETAVSLRFGTG